MKIARTIGRESCVDSLFMGEGGGEYVDSISEIGCLGGGCTEPRVRTVHDG